MAQFHKLKAWLYDSVLTANPNGLIARIISEKSLNVNDVSLSAEKRGGATISAQAMTNAVNQWLKEMGYLLCDGFSVNTGWFTASANIRGVFDSPAEKFSPAKHSVIFTFNQGALLRKEIAGVEVQILGVADKAMMIAQVTDIKTGTVNNLLTPNRNLRIAGAKIKIAGDNPAIGIFFVNGDTGERLRVHSSETVINNPSDLLIVIPELAAGTYRLEITTQFTGNALLKEPRTAVFDYPLTVE
jgi:hypothetical protein